MAQYVGESNKFHPDYVPRDTEHEHLGMRLTADTWTASGMTTVARCQS